MSSATMPKKQKPPSWKVNEFELVLGNKQLLSVFFIVVILLGVFFTMGYVVRTEFLPRRYRAQQQTNRTNGRMRRALSPMPETAAGAGATGCKSAPAAASRRVAPAPVAQKPIELPAVTVTQPQVGQTYLQVLAVAKPEAEVLAEVLAKKGFRALVAPGPNERVFRVLVGPAKDVDDAGKLKTDLEAAGFKPFVKKY